MSALSLMAFDRHKYLKVKPGDVVVFSSKFIPGNEKAINQIINEFSRRGAQVMYEKISNVLAGLLMIYMALALASKVILGANHGAH